MNVNRTRSIWLAVLFLLWNAQASRAQITFDDIRFWVGSGANRAALVIDWNSGAAPQSLVWGYRWDGPATGLTLFEAIAAADPRFYYEWVPGLERGAVFGIGFDVDGDGFSKSDPDDRYQEGWFANGFWAYYIDTVPGSSIPTEGPSANRWRFSPTGLASRTLVDGSWDGWSWAPNFRATRPSVPVPVSAPVPEPGTLVLFGGLSTTGAAFVVRRRK